MAEFDEKALEEFINNKLNPPARVEIVGREQKLSQLLGSKLRRIARTSDVSLPPELP